MSAAVLQQKRSPSSSKGPAAPASDNQAIPGQLKSENLTVNTELIKQTEQSLRVKLASLNRLYLADTAGFDCGECADALRSICPPEILEAKHCNRLRFSATSKEGRAKFIYLPEQLAVKNEYDYHYAFIFRGKVYDPFISAEPIGYNQYISQLREHNSAITPGSRLHMESVRRSMNTTGFDSLVKNRGNIKSSLKNPPGF